MKIIKKTFIFAFIMHLFSPVSITNALSLKKTAENILQIGSAIYIQGTLHELGHMAVANQLQADSQKMEFFTSKDGNFYFGLNTAKGVKEKSLVSYRMGGFVFSNITYEFALSSYRQKPTLFNYTLALLSSTDFSRYSMFAFYFGDSNVDEYDPAYFQRESGFSKEAIMLTALSQTAINLYRLYSGKDTLIPFVDFYDNYVEDFILIGFKVRY